MDEGKIIQLFLKRDERALSESARMYGSYCLKIAKNIVGNDQDAQECVNDAFLKAWESIPPQNPQSLQAYLGVLTRNTAYNAHRACSAQKRGGSMDDVLLELEEAIPSSGGVEEELDNASLSRALNGFLEQLPVQSRQVFVKRYWYAESIKNISQTVGKSEAAISSQLRRLRKQLKNYLEEKGHAL